MRLLLREENKSEMSRNEWKRSKRCSLNLPMHTTLTVALLLFANQRSGGYFVRSFAFPPTTTTTTTTARTFDRKSKKQTTIRSSRSDAPSFGSRQLQLHSRNRLQQNDADVGSSASAANTAIGVGGGGGRNVMFSSVTTSSTSTTSTRMISEDSAAATAATTTSRTGTGSLSGGDVVSASSLYAGPPSTKTEKLDAYSYRRAIQRTLFWVVAASLFGGTVWVLAGPEIGEEFFAGYLVEQSLSVDNLFVFLLLFEYFKVPLSSQDRVLNWGILGAMVFRAIMIGLGAVAIKEFHAVLLLFAGILIYSSGKILLAGDDDEEEDPGQNSIVKFSRNLFDSTDDFDGDRFFTVADGVRKATPLFICMVAVEISDIVFAVDSIPAIFGITENPLVVFSSNLFAIMGLRSLYTILSKAATDLKYLEPAVAFVLGFIGCKMIGEYFEYSIPTAAALAVVASMLSTGVGLSLWDRQLQLQLAAEDGLALENGGAEEDGDDDDEDNRVEE